MESFKDKGDSSNRASSGKSLNLVSTVRLFDGRPCLKLANQAS